jgi:hypothetical protein
MSDGSLTIEATVASVANKATYGGGAAAFYGGMTANEIAAYGGLLVAVIGLIVQLVFKIREDRRSKEFHRKRMAGLDEREG